MSVVVALAKDVEECDTNGDGYVRISSKESMYINCSCSKILLTA